MSSKPLTVRAITAAEHRAYVASQPAVALEQTPGWGRGFVAARTESVGWFEGDTMIGAGLFRFRGLPRLPMRSVAVFEIGPDIDWMGRRRPRLELNDWTKPLVDHLRNRGVFTVRINPPVVEQQWWGIDPAQRSESLEVVLHSSPATPSDAVVTTRRLESSGWKPLTKAHRVFTADVALADARGNSKKVSKSSGEVAPGYSGRAGTPDDLEAVAAVVAAAHPGIDVPPLRDWQQRWRGLASDDMAGVGLRVIELNGDVVYGGLFAIVGSKAYDLSIALPQPDADRPQVQVLRAQVMKAARAAGAHTLTVPTVVSDRRAPVDSPAPGWPPVHLCQLIGTYQFAVRSTWHGALAPIVDRLVL